MSSEALARATARSAATSNLLARSAIRRRLQGGDVVGKSLGSGIHETKGIIVFAIRGALKCV